MTAQNERLKRAARNLQEIMKELEPYTRKPVVEELSTKGTWIRGDGTSERATDDMGRLEAIPNNYV